MGRPFRVCKRLRASAVYECQRDTGELAIRTDQWPGVKFGLASIWLLTGGTITSGSVDWRRGNGFISSTVRQLPTARCAKDNKYETHDEADDYHKHCHQDEGDENHCKRNRNKDRDEPTAPNVTAQAPNDAGVICATPSNERWNHDPPNVCDSRGKRGYDLVEEYAGPIGLHLRCPCCYGRCCNQRSKSFERAAGDVQHDELRK
jgi:hypothetical protein